MITISSENKLVTVIVVFSVNPEQQQDFIAAIAENLETVVKKSPGFISSTIHKSTDGMQVVNYIQWQSMDHYHGYLQNAPRFNGSGLTAPPNMRVYEVEYQGVGQN
jgi:antibiotic biosynthesis monooxygenase (ABM) superfamily enzyme